MWIEFPLELYLTFLLTLLLSSCYCAVIDLMYNNKKINDKIITQKELLYQYKKILPIVSINCFIIIPIFLYTSTYIYEIEYSYNKFNILSTLASLFVGIFMIDFFFYIGHFIMHNKYLYKWSHKIHHEFAYPVGLEALYLHWFDLIFGNIIPLYLPILILNNHIYTLLLWTIFTISSTVLIAHSSFNDKFHLNHHIYRNVNYGHGTYMDKLFKTEIISQ